MECTSTQRPRQLHSSQLSLLVGEQRIQPHLSAAAAPRRVRMPSRSGPALPAPPPCCAPPSALPGRSEFPPRPEQSNARVRVSWGVHRKALAHARVERRYMLVPLAEGIVRRMKGVAHGQPALSLSCPTAAPHRIILGHASSACMAGQGMGATVSSSASSCAVRRSRELPAG